MHEPDCRLACWWLGRVVLTLPLPLPTGRGSALSAPRWRCRDCPAQPLGVCARVSFSSPCCALCPRGGLRQPVHALSSSRPRVYDHAQGGVWMLRTRSVRLVPLVGATRGHTHRVCPGTHTHKPQGVLDPLPCAATAHKCLLTPRVPWCMWAGRGLACVRCSGACTAPVPHYTLSFGAMRGRGGPSQQQFAWRRRGSACALLAAVAVGAACAALSTCCGEARTHGKQASALCILFAPFVFGCKFWCACCSSRALACSMQRQQAAAWPAGQRHTAAAATPALRLARFAVTASCHAHIHARTRHSVGRSEELLAMCGCVPLARRGCAVVVADMYPCSCLRERPRGPMGPCVDARVRVTQDP
jgi:hypothetical protein